MGTERLSRDQMIALPEAELERIWPSNYASIANSVADAMANMDAVSGKGCHALPFLLDDPDDSVASCDVDGSCDRHGDLAQVIGPRVRRWRKHMRARSGS